MSYDVRLADRVRQVTSAYKGVTERSMFGGLAFLIGGRMFCGVVDERLMIRVGPGHYEAALKERHVGLMDFTGRPMKGYVFVDPPGVRTCAAVQRWVARGATFTATLGAKTDRGRRPSGKSGRVVKARP